MKQIILLLSLMFLTGCSTIASLVSGAAEVNDEALIAAEFTICKASSIGSVLRRYNTPIKAKAWKDLCSDENNTAEKILNDAEIP